MNISQIILVMDLEKHILRLKVMVVHLDSSFQLHSYDVDTE